MTRPSGNHGYELLTERDLLHLVYTFIIVFNEDISIYVMYYLVHIHLYYINRFNLRISLYNIYIYIYIYIII